MVQLDYNKEQGSSVCCLPGSIVWGFSECGLTKYRGTMGHLTTVISSRKATHTLPPPGNRGGMIETETVVGHLGGGRQGPSGKMESSNTKPGAVKCHSAIAFAGGGGSLSSIPNSISQPIQGGGDLRGCHQRPPGASGRGSRRGWCRRGVAAGRCTGGGRPPPSPSTTHLGTAAPRSTPERPRWKEEKEEGPGTPPLYVVWDTPPPTSPGSNVLLRGPWGARRSGEGRRTAGRVLLWVRCWSQNRWFQMGFF